MIPRRAQLAPVLRQESESERLARPARRGAQGAIHANLFQRSPDKRRGGKDVEHLMLRTPADWTVTLRPVGYTQRVESFRARLVEPTPETKARALDSEAASMVHWHRRQPTASATRDTVGQRPLSTAGLKIRTDSKFASVPESEPPREVPSMPSATRVKPGT